VVVALDASLKVIRTPPTDAGPTRHHSSTPAEHILHIL